MGSQSQVDAMQGSLRYILNLKVLSQVPPSVPYLHACCLKSDLSHPLFFVLQLPLAAVAYGAQHEA